MFYQQWTVDEQERMKNQVITELFKSKSLHKLIDKTLYKNNVHRDTHILEDVVQHVFMQLSRKPAAFVLSLYYDDGKCPGGMMTRLIGLCCRISFREGVGSSSRDIDYPKHSVTKHILFASNFQKLAYISPTEEGCTETNHFTNVLVDESTEEPDNFTNMWALVQEHLSPGELKDLQKFMYDKKKQGRYTTEVYEKRKRLLNKIEAIIGQHKVYIPSKPVIQLDVNGKQVDYFHTVQEAAVETCIPANEITRCCADKKLKRSAGGFKWMYADTEPNI
jgi:hypothetical protein